ncbi:MAG: acireductone synthase [Bacteroidetes bacterium]|nr:acireductone synthase [Bacteroidota bacterium]
MPHYPKPDILLTDIEGTTTDAQFVHQVLFPYAHDALEAYVRQHATDPVVLAILHDAACAIENETGTRPDVATTVAAFQQWIQEDRKQTALKALQGLIWADGYARGDFTSHLYADVLPALQRWQAQGIALGVYSSGSIHAQQQLFAHTVHGDLTPMFRYYFDTTSGPKREEQSYRNILAALGYGHAPDKVCFLSDIEAELDAAAAAGLQTIQLVRPGTLPGSSHSRATTFDEIIFQS